MKTQFALLTITFLSLAALAADVTGTWKAEFETPRGLQKYTFEFKQDGASVNGKAKVERDDEKRDAELKEGKVEGDTITFVELLKIQDNELRITYTGRISGNEIKFIRSIGDLGSSEATARREGAIAEAAATQTASTNAGATNAPEGRRGRGFGGPIARAARWLGSRWAAGSRSTSAWAISMSLPGLAASLPRRIRIHLNNSCPTPAR